MCYAEKSPEFLQEMRNYCAGCTHTFNCPVGMYNFKTCTQKGSNLIRLKGKHIPTWAEEQATIQKLGSKEVDS